MARLPMEAGYDRVHENFGAALSSPILGLIGLTSFFGGNRPPLIAGIVSFVIIVGMAVTLLFRCRTVPAFWSLVAANAIVITVSSFGFCQFARYWSDNP